MAIFSGVTAVVSAIGGAISAVSAFSIGKLAVGSFLLKAAVGTGINLLASAIAGRGKKQSASFSLKGQLQSGGTVSRSVILGMTATAGSLAYANTWGSAGGTPNAYVTQVIAVSDLPVKDLVAVIVNGVSCELDRDNPHAEYGWPVVDYRRDGTDYLWIKLHDGNQTAADSFVVNRVSSSDRPYESTRVGLGVAYVVATSRINQELFTGFPSFKFVLEGARLYDVSKDSTAGGNGPQRWGDQATWGGDGDHLPAVQLYNLLRGIRFAGQWLTGLQTLAERRLPSAHWVGQVNRCRALIEGPDGMEATYRSGAEVPVSATVQDVAEGVLTAAQGRLAETGGVYKAHLGAPGDPVMHFTDDDILSTEPQSFTPFFGLSDTVNGISASYPSPDDGWNVAEAPPLYNDDFEAEDGGRRLLADVDIDFVPYKGQVQRLMQSALAEARRARRHTIAMPPRFWVLEPGDIVSWTSARNGYVTKRFRVDGVLDQPNLDVVLDLTEVDPADYGWNQGADYRPPVNGSLSPGWPVPQVMTGWSVQPSNIDGKRPAILVGCAADVDDVARVHVQVRLKATGAVVFDSDSTVYAAPYSWLLSGAWCLSLTAYELRGKYVPYSHRPTEWGTWLEVTTGDYSETDFTADLAHIGDDVRARFQELAAEMNDYLRPTMERIVVDFSLMAAASQVAREAIMAEAGSARVEIVEEKRVRADETAALGQLYTALRASFNSNVASVQTMLTTLANADSALASSISAVEATAAGNTAAIASEATARADGDAALTTQVNQLWAASDDNAAAITAEQTARSNADGALATSISNVQAAANTAVANEATARQNADNALSGNIATVNAAVQSEATARADADGALATSISGVSADFNGRFAQGLIRFQAVSAPSGIDARFAIVIRGGTSDSYKVTGLYLDLYTEAGVQKSRLAIMTDQFVVTDGTNSSAALTFEAGQLKALFARFGTVNAGILQSPNGKMVINLTAGTIVVSS